jgi:hypothetical protein
MNVRILAWAALAAGLLSFPNMAWAQVKVAAGESVDGEFTERGQKHLYAIEMKPGEQILVHVESVGRKLFTTIGVLDPLGDTIERALGQSLSHDLKSEELSARGEYVIEVKNRQGVGNYTISFGKIDSDGVEIAPGSKAADSAEAEGTETGESADESLEGLRAEVRAMRKKLDEIEAMRERLDEIEKRLAGLEKKKR